MTASVFSHTGDQTEFATGTSIVADMPSIVAGRLAVALVGVGPTNASAVVFTTPSGWTKQFERLTQFDHQRVCFSRTLSGAEGATETFSADVSRDWQTNILSIIDHDGIDVTAQSANGFGSTHDSPSVTTTVDDCLVITCLALSGDADDHTVTPPGSTSALFDYSGFAAGGPTLRVIARSFVQASAGATGTRSWSWTGGDTVVSGFTIAIKPAAAGGGGNLQARDTKRRFFFRGIRRYG